MTSSNSQPKKRGPKPKPDKQGRSRKASSDYRERQRKERQAMLEVVTAAEKLHKAIEQANDAQQWYAAFMLGSTPLETLHNITAYIESDSKKHAQKGDAKKEAR